MKIGLCKSSVLGPISVADESMLDYAVHLHQAGHEVSLNLLFPSPVDDQYLHRLKLKGVAVTTVIPQQRHLIRANSEFNRHLKRMYLLRLREENTCVTFDLRAPVHGHKVH